MNGFQNIRHNDESKTSDTSEPSITTSAEPIDDSPPTLSIVNYFNFNGSEAIHNVEKYIVDSQTQPQSHKQSHYKSNHITKIENGFIFQMNTNRKAPSFELRPLQQPVHKNKNRQKNRNRRNRKHNNKKNANNTGNSGMSGINQISPNKQRQSNDNTADVTHSLSQTHQQHTIASNTNNRQRLETAAHRNGNVFVAPSHSHNNNGNVIRNMRNESELQRRNMNNMQQLLTHNIEQMHINGNVQTMNTRNMNNIQNLINNLSKINVNPPQNIQNMQMDMNNNNNVVPPAPMNNNNNNHNNNMVPQMNTNNNDQAPCYPVLRSNEQDSHSNLHSAPSVSYCCDDSKPDNIETRAQNDNKPCIPLQEPDYGHGGGNLPARDTKWMTTNNEDKKKKRECPYKFCKKSFPTKLKLTVHIRTHTGEKPYKCKFEKCNQSFAQKGNLTRHLNSHNGIRPFQCKLCLQRFKQKVHLKKHMKSKAHRNDTFQ